jgi:hypothetical protein
MVVNPLWQWIFGVLHFGLAGLTIYLALRNPMRHRDWWEVLFRTVILCSGALGAVVFEGAVDRAGKLWYAEYGAWLLVQFWGTMFRFGSRPFICGSSAAGRCSLSSACAMVAAPRLPLHLSGDRDCRSAA